ncbi:MAG: response regulator transcription factor [Roseburia sp.]|nr:response regulator transcription factor [Roseburia sp.]MCM1099588.1 response regulator transcription factor [Ruminococcus flavefaciens]
MSEGMKILLVEDNEAIILGLEYLLEQERYRPRTSRGLAEARQEIQDFRPDLILLDVSLPDGDGFAFCAELKKAGSCPVIFLTAREEEADVVKGLDLGAEDYVIKPFRNRELISRIKNVLRRNGKAGSCLSCREIELNLETGKVYRSGKELKLTRLEYRILSSMLSYPGKLFTREEILSQIWDISGNFVNDNTLSVTMKRLREKIGDSDGEIIKTVRGIGYRIEK